MAGGEIWAYAEQRDGVLQEASLELVGEARRLGEKVGASAAALLLGHQVRTLATVLASYGASRVYVLDDAMFAAYAAGPFTRAVGALLKMHEPALALFPATSEGAELAPRVAARLDLPMVSGCVGIQTDDRHSFVLTRPVYGGQLYAQVVSQKAGPVVATVKPGVIGLDSPNRPAQVEIIDMAAEIGAADLWTQVLDFIRADPRTVDLCEAEIIVSGGRGVGSKEGFRKIEELADALGGSVAGTRPAVDAGWIPFERQIGQTGKVVAPRLYVACGISGASHHNIGIKGSKVIIAVNKDRHAPIFGIADVGIVGDLHDVLPALTGEVRRVRSRDAAKAVK